MTNPLTTITLENAFLTFNFDAKKKVCFPRHELPTIHRVWLKYATKIFWGNEVNGAKCLLILHNILTYRVYIYIT
jgi:hypothetical protein